MSKKLVAYFSASGVTAKVAETLAEAIGADIFEIEPKVPYTEADLNWMDKKARSTIEMNNPASRPEIAVKRDNMKDYDTILVGFPIWWYVAPTIINTCLLYTSTGEAEADPAGSSRCTGDQQAYDYPVRERHFLSPYQGRLQKNRGILQGRCELSADRGRRVYGSGIRAVRLPWHETCLLYTSSSA